MEKHVNHPVVYRAFRHSKVEKEDFFPTIVERANENKQKLFNVIVKQPTQSQYSVSLYTSSKQLKHLFMIPGFRKRHEAIAKGFTTIHRGCSYEANENGHVDYFLFDYIDNNPCVDFELFEEMNKDE